MADEILDDVSDRPGPQKLPAGDPSGTPTVSFGPSVFMVVAGLACHPLAWLGGAGALFSESKPFRIWLWQFDFPLWRELLLKLWDLNTAYPGWWIVALLAAGVHLGIQFKGTRFGFNDSYLFVETGLGTVGGPSGFFSVYNDPIAFTTVIDANTRRGLLGLITGTGTILLRTSELEKGMKLKWVPNVKWAQGEIIARAGVRDARVLSSI